MKQQFVKYLQRFAVIMLGTLVLGQAAQAENNIGTGDVAGDAAALADSNVFVLNSGGALTLVKTAYLTSGGTVLPSGSTLPSGTQVDFLIFVNNMSSVSIDDVSIQDVLDPLFVYQAGTIRVDNAVANCAAATCDAGEIDAIYASAILPANAESDGLDADTASFAGVTVDAGNENVANGQLDVAANTVMALVFTVEVQ